MWLRRKSSTYQEFFSFLNLSWFKNYHRYIKISQNCFQYKLGYMKIWLGHFIYTFKQRFFHKVHEVVQWREYSFLLFYESSTGAPTPQGAAPTYEHVEFSQKLHEI